MELPDIDTNVYIGWIEVHLVRTHTQVTCVCMYSTYVRSCVCVPVQSCKRKSQLEFILSHQLYMWVFMKTLQALCVCVCVFASATADVKAPPHRYAAVFTNELLYMLSIRQNTWNRILERFFSHLSECTVHCTAIRRVCLFNNTNNNNNKSSNINIDDINNKSGRIKCHVFHFIYSRSYTFISKSGGIKSSGLSYRKKN